MCSDFAENWLGGCLEGGEFKTLTFDICLLGGCTAGGKN